MYVLYELYNRSAAGVLQRDRLAVYFCMQPAEGGGTAMQRLSS